MKTKPDGLQQEAKAFDNQAVERVRHGHIPDLRCVKPCDWFYNNPWRRPYLVDMVFGRYFRFAMANIKGRTLLEIGAGVGHMALEFARNGLQVTGLELSPEAVAVARRFASENPFRENFGSLDYVSADFLTWEPVHQFDNVCFFGTLHHFQSPDQALARVQTVLEPEGRIIVVEPARDWHNERDAALISLMRWLLAAYGGWYEALPLPANEAEMAQTIQDVLSEFQEAHGRKEPEQSPHDNATFASEMLATLRGRFREVTCESGFAFLPRVGGGVRASAEEKSRQVAEFLHLFDKYAVSHGFLNPGGFLWAGENRPLARE